MSKPDGTTNEEGEKIRNKSAALVAVLISIGAVMGQMSVGPLNLTKTAEPTMTYVGGQVTYAYVVNNTGQVGLSAVSLSDDALGHIAGPFDLAAETWLTFQVTTNIENDTLNNATAAGFDPDGNEVRAVATAFVDVIHPNLTLTKTVNSTMIYRNQAVNYTFFINNTGDVDITAINLTDDHLGKIAGLFGLAPGQNLAVSRVVVVEDDVLNNATLAGLDPLGTNITAKASTFVDVIHPRLTLVKSVDPRTASYGGEVTYTFFINNTGDVNVTAMNITDDHLGRIAGPFNLTPAQSLTFSIKATMYSTTFNTATAVGLDPLGNPVRASDSAAMRVLTPTDMRSVGYWKHQFSEKGHKHLTEEGLMAYLALIADESRIFEEIFQLSYANATSYLWIGKASMLNRSVQQCLACWLNWANGAVGMGDMVDADWDGQLDMTFSDAMALVEDLIANGDDNKDYEKAKSICDSINNMGEPEDGEEDEDDDKEGEEGGKEQDEEDGEDEENDHEQEPAVGRGPPENVGEPQGRGPPDDKTPPVNRGPPEDKGEPQGRGPPEEKPKAKSAKK